MNSNLKEDLKLNNIYDKTTFKPINMSLYTNKWLKTNDIKHLTINKDYYILNNQVLVYNTEYTFNENSMCNIIFVSKSVNNWRNDDNNNYDKNKHTDTYKEFQTFLYNKNKNKIGRVIYFKKCITFRKSDDIYYKKRCHDIYYFPYYIIQYIKYNSSNIESNNISINSNYNSIVKISPCYVVKNITNNSFNVSCNTSFNNEFLIVLSNKLLYQIKEITVYFGSDSIRESGFVINEFVICCNSMY